MSAHVIAERYASALLGIAVKRNQVDPLANELNDLCAMLTETPALQYKLLHPTTTQTQREHLLNTILEQSAASSLLIAFTRCLNSKRRLELFDEISQAYHRLADTQQHRLRAEAIVAEALGETRETRLRTLLEQRTGKQVILRIREDASLLGGIVLRMGSEVWDLSLRQQLNQLEGALVAGLS